MKRTVAQTAVLGIVALGLAACSSTSGEPVSKSSSGQSSASTAASSAAASSDAFASDETSDATGAGSSDAASAEASDSSDDNSTAKFGQAYKYQDGITVSVTRPKHFKPSQYAAGTSKSKPNAFVYTIKLTNGSKKIFDPALFSTDATMVDHECESIFDSDKGLEGSPDSKLRVGKSITWNEAYACKAKSGEFQLQVSPGFEYDDALFVGLVR